MDKQEKLFQQLQHIAVRRSDEHRAWSRIFYGSVIAHAVMLVGLFNAYNDRVRWQLLIIAGFGLVITVTITLVTRKILHAVESAELIAGRIEKKLVESSDLCDDMAYFVVNGKWGRSVVSSRVVLYTFNGVMFLFWAMALSYNIFLEVRH